MSEKDNMVEIMKGIEETRKLAESKAAETAEVKAQMAKIEADFSAKFEESQKTELAAKEEAGKLAAEVKRISDDYADLYKKANRLGLGNADSEEIAMFRGYGSEMDAYLRKGVLPGSESLKEIATYMAKNALVTQDETSQQLEANKFLRENGDNSGYPLFNTKSMVTGSNPDGGYLTTPDRRTDISVKRIFETSPMRALANIITTTSNEVEIPIDDNQSTSGGWTGEVTAPTVTDQAQVGMLTIAAHEQFAMPKATQKMLDDGSINIEAWLSGKTDDILRRTENTAFVSGTGAASPKGFVSYAAWAVNGTYERNKIEQIVSGVSGVVKADGLISLQNSLLEDYQSNAVFLMKRATFGEVSKLKDGNGQYLLNTMMLPEGATMTVLGKPVYFANDLATIAADSLSIAYGDFGVGYTIVDRLGIRVLRDPYTDKPFVRFYTTKRVGGAVTNYQAIKLQKLSA